MYKYIGHKWEKKRVAQLLGISTIYRLREKRDCLIRDELLCAVRPYKLAL